MRFSTRLKPYSTVVQLEIVPANHPDLVKHGAEALTYPPEEGTIRVLLSEGSSIGTAAHECLHAVAFALKDAGLRFGRATEEAYAYALGDLVDWMAAKLQPPVGPQ
jgi:hypothetical protein